MNFVTPRNPYDPCMNGGVCSFNIVNNQVEFECAFPAGFTGVFCQNGEPACDKVCQNQSVLDSGACACTCPVGITGEYCEVTPCNPYNPCINGSTCSSDIVNNAVEFDCDQVTSLIRCIVDVCGDNEFCQILTDLNYACLCNNGYFGDHCEFGPCDAVNCLNGGVETLNGVSCFCQCPASYSGASCEDTPCDPNH